MSAFVVCIKIPYPKIIFKQLLLLLASAIIVCGLCHTLHIADTLATTLRTPR